MLSEIPKEHQDEIGVYIDYAEEHLDHWPPEMRKPICRWTMADEGQLEVHRLIPDLGGDYIVLPSEVERLAPDAKSIVAATKLATPSKWIEHARGRDVLWGVVSGSSSDYCVIAGHKAKRYDCSCPSRKRPCKHVLALLLMATSNEVFPRRPMSQAHEDNAVPPRYGSTWE